MPIRGFASRFASKQPGFQSTQPLVELGGLNEDENPQALRPTDLKVAKNCTRKGSMMGTRPGLIYGDGDFTDALSSGAAVQGIAEFIRHQDADRDVVVVCGGEVYLDDTLGALDKATNSVTITTGANNHWRFASFQDKIFAAGGADADSFWFWDGTGVAPTAQLDKVALGFDVKYVFSKWNMLFVGGANGTTYDDNSLIARYCDYASDATDPANWKSSNVIPGQLLGENFGIGSRGSEFNTGFASYTDNRGDFFLFLTNKRIVSFTPNPNLTSNADAFIISDTIATGCVSQDAYVGLGLDSSEAVYLSQDGIHSLSQSQQYGNRSDAYLSWPIRNTFKTLNQSRLKYASGAYWATEGLVLFSVSTGSNTTNDLILCLDVRGVAQLTPETARWYKWDVSGINPNKIVPMRGSDGKPYPYVGGTAGEVCRFERNAYSDLATGNIDTIIQTRDEDYGVPSREKHIGDLYCSIQGIGDYTINHTFMLDDGFIEGQTSRLPVPNAASVWDVAVWDVAEWSNAEALVRHRVPGVGSSPTIGHRFQHGVANEPFWVGLINQEVMVSGPNDDQTANVVGS